MEPIKRLKAANINLILHRLKDIRRELTFIKIELIQQQEKNEQVINNQ